MYGVTGKHWVGHVLLQRVHSEVRRLIEPDCGKNAEHLQTPTILQWIYFYVDIKTSCSILGVIVFGFAWQAIEQRLSRGTFIICSCG